MFFKYDTIIDDSITVKELQEFLRTHNIYLDIVDNSTEWAAFSQYYAHKHGLGDIAAASFSYMVSLFMTGMGVSASTEAYFREETIEGLVLDEFNSLKDLSDEDKAVKLFEFIFELYSKDISKYEYKVERLAFRLGIDTYNQFLNVEGESKADKLNTLLRVYYSQ